MAEQLTTAEKHVIKAMEALGANKDSALKGVDEISVKANRPSGLVANLLTSLTSKKAVKRVIKEKTAGYYLTK